MSITSWFKNLFSSPTVKTIETDVEQAFAAGATYIKANGLQLLYQLALTLITDTATGTQWETLLTHLKTQATTQGIILAKGAEAIVLAQAQADLIALGKLASPSTGATVPNA